MRKLRAFFLVVAAVLGAADPLDLAGASTIGPAAGSGGGQSGGDGGGQLDGDRPDRCNPLKLEAHDAEIPLGE